MVGWNLCGAICRPNVSITRRISGNRAHTPASWLLESAAGPQPGRAGAAGWTVRACPRPGMRQEAQMQTIRGCAVPEFGNFLGKNNVLDSLHDAGGDRRKW